MPITCAFTLLYRAISSLTAHNSFVQVLVNACGKNKSKTFFSLKSPRDVFFLSVSNKLKCGAGIPVSIFIAGNLFLVKIGVV
jgi:hypothetical protein